MSAAKGLTVQNRKVEFLCAGLLSVALLLLIILVSSLAKNNEIKPSAVEVLVPITVLPDFASIADIDTKKQQFFDFLQDYVAAENKKISDSRKQLLNYAEVTRHGGGLSGYEQEWLLNLASGYKLNTKDISEKDLIETLLQRVDVIPASLVLAQAANESNWGTSRFALEGNNIFGQWCYKPGCGIIPSRREDGATHEVKRFDSISSAMEGYFLNINTHHLYNDFREIRANLRTLGQSLDPILLAYGLDRYSQRGKHYIEEMQTLIRQNGLESRDSRLMDN